MLISNIRNYLNKHKIKQDLDIHHAILNNYKKMLQMQLKKNLVKKVYTEINYYDYFSNINTKLKVKTSSLEVTPVDIRMAIKDTNKLILTDVCERYNNRNVSEKKELIKNLTNTVSKSSYDLLHEVFSSIPNDSNVVAALKANNIDYEEITLAAKQISEQAVKTIFDHAGNIELTNMVKQNKMNIYTEVVKDKMLLSEVILQRKYDELQKKRQSISAIKKMASRRLTQHSKAISRKLSINQHINNVR